MKLPQPFEMPFPAQANEMGRFKRPISRAALVVDSLLNEEDWTIKDEILSLADDDYGKDEAAENAQIALQRAREKLRDRKLESQYTHAYLSGNTAKGDGNGLTLGSFLAYELRGTAKSYAGRYARNLEASIQRYIDLGLAYEGTSRGGRSAYYFVDDADLEAQELQATKEREARAIRRQQSLDRMDALTQRKEAERQAKTDWAYNADEPQLESGVRRVVGNNVF